MPIELPAILYSIPRNPILAVGLPLLIPNLESIWTKDNLVTWYRPLRKPPVRVLAEPRITVSTRLTSVLTFLVGQPSELCVPNRMDHSLHNHGTTHACANAPGLRANMLSNA